MKWAKFVTLMGALWLTTAAHGPCAGRSAPLLAKARGGRHSRSSRRARSPKPKPGWRSLLSSQPNDAEAYAHLGLLEARQEHYKEAIVLYRKALSLNPKMPGLRLNLGLSYFKAGDLRRQFRPLNPCSEGAQVLPGSASPGDPDWACPLRNG